MPQKTTVNITRRHEGKMSGIWSLNSSSTITDFCRKNSKCKKTVCYKCYSNATEENIPDYQNAWARNYHALNSIDFQPFKIEKKEIDIFRLHSFGEVSSLIHFFNLMKVVRNNPDVLFTLWTKRNNIVNRFFDHEEKPSNLILIYSSPVMNKSANIECRGLRHFDKIFTVYTEDHIAKNGIAINCGDIIDEKTGKREKCINCRLCYERNNIKYINEILKSGVGYTISKNK